MMQADVQHSEISPKEPQTLTINQSTQLDGRPPEEEALVSDVTPSDYRSASAQNST